ncbi:MAG: Holliday junction resolvase RuvX [Rothia sp. (in: high G+C Gram-positive bacteria)]|nr:Holliday junction resolvase RuvX [Rothia sp. (in: high G+C Gram-positive bacteria)]
MGVDVGMARVGLALCDPDGILASPLKTLRRDLKKNSDRRVLLKLLEVNEVTEVFVGLPKTLRGTDSPSTQMAIDYAQALVKDLQAAGLDLPVWLIDERLTTVSAHRSLHEAGVSSRDFRSVVDQVAAVNILQHTLDTIKAGQVLAGYQVQLPRDLVTTETCTPTDERENPDV